MVKLHNEYEKKGKTLSKFSGKLVCCITGVKSLITSSKWKLSDQKTEALLFPPGHFIVISHTIFQKSRNPHLYLYSSARSQGCIISKDMSLDHHITYTCLSAYTGLFVNSNFLTAGCPQYTNACQ